MDIELAQESGFRLHRLRARNDLSISILPNGCVYSIECGEILINQVLASPLEGGIHRIYLRIHCDDGIKFIEIVGPRACSALGCSSDRFTWTGSWEGLRYRCTCWVHPGGGGWFFHLELENATDSPIRCDAVIVQDIGLATRAQVRNNEIFTSQYLDHSTLRDPKLGLVLMTRQNLAQTEEKLNPWLMQGCLPRAKGFTTDGLDFFGIGYKANTAPIALSKAVIGEHVRQSEVGYTAVQSNEIDLQPTHSRSCTFFVSYVAHHPHASSDADADRLKSVRAIHAEMLTAVADREDAHPASAAQSIFQTSETLAGDELAAPDIERLFPLARRHEEVEHDRLLSFFYSDARHVVFQSKELSAARPCGHILRAGCGLTPDAKLMSCAHYAAGIFASGLTLGHTALAKLLSSSRDPLNILRCKGLRIFVRQQPSDPWSLLGVASAFEMAMDECRWLYRHGSDLLTVSCTASQQQARLDFDVHVEGRPLEALISGEIVAGANEYDFSPRLSINLARRFITITPDRQSTLGERQPALRFQIESITPDEVDAIGGDELLFADQQPRGYPYFAIRTRPTTSFRFAFVGSEADAAIAAPAAEAKSDFWETMKAGVKIECAARDRAGEMMQDTLSWFARDALIHLSVPRGLEQPNGGAWGVRDVCQGPIEFLLSYDHPDAVADILRKVFSRQYRERHDWPQWFALPPFQHDQSPECHGDVLIWPLTALCDYLEHANDATILRERLPYTDDQTLALTDRREEVLEHVDRLIGKMRKQFLPGVALPRYGDGDWDDSLQPADPRLRQRMASSWTAALMHQTLQRYATALSHFGEVQRADSVGALAAAIRDDFQRCLMPDGVVAGFALFDGEPSLPIEYLVHPSDTRTRLHYRLIAMTRGILSRMFSSEQADHHLALLNEHLLFPDGARLMDRPSAYAGGVERTFRRSESAAFFGREIGLQYVHAHLRYAQAMAAMGRADDLWRALLVANPIAVTDVVPNARPRQRNCYFSSSDAAFADRYHASRDYEELRCGEVATEGGWRIYSSGPGIYTSVVIRHLLGLRRHFDWYEFDPVLPRELDGIACEMELGGKRVRYTFTVREGHFSPRRIIINGQPMANLQRLDNPYRDGGVRIRRTELDSRLIQPLNVIQIEL